MTSRIKVPATLDNLHEAIAFVVSRAESAGVSPDRIMEIELALEEALVNIINYAYPDGAGDIEIGCAPFGGSGFAVEISDWGIPFNVLDVDDPDVTSGIEDRKVGGLGIYFVRKLMDDVRYSREGESNVLRLIVQGNKPNS